MAREGKRLSVGSVPSSVDMESKLLDDERQTLFERQAGNIVDKKKTRLGERGKGQVAGWKGQIY